MSAPVAQAAEVIRFGIDLASPVTPALLAQVVGAYGAPIDFVGRYTEELSGISTALTREERDAILNAGPAILLVYNGALPQDVASSYAVGAANARVAAAHLRALGVPDGVACAVDIEAGWLPSKYFAQGWIETLHAAGYIPVFYCNILEQTHSYPLFLAIQNAGLPAFIWSSEPEYTSWWNTRKMDFYDYSGALGAEHAALVVANQYGEGELGDRVDLNNARDALWRVLLHKTPPVPPPTPGRKEVIAACGLKHVPADGGPNEATIPAEGEVMDTGKRRLDWAYVQWRQFWGWVKSANLESLAADPSVTTQEGAVYTPPPGSTPTWQSDTGGGTLTVDGQPPPTSDQQETTHAGNSTG